MKFVITNAFRDKKKYFIFYLFFQLIFIGIFLLINTYEYYDYQINYVIGSNESNRGLEANIDNLNVEELFNNIPYIKEYYPLYNNQTAIYQNKPYQVNQIFNNKIKYGRNIEDDNEIVLSIYCFKQLNLTEKDLGNKEMKLFYNNKYYKFKIVGVTNNNHTHIYISSSSFNNIFRINPKSYYLLVDEYLNIPKTKKILEEKNISSGLYDDSYLKKIEDIKKIQKQYVYILIIITPLVIYFIKNIIKNIVLSESKNIALLKILGYKIKMIKGIVSIRLSIVILLSYIITLLISFIINFFTWQNHLLFDLKTISLIFFIIIIIKNVYILNHKTKINVLEIMQDI